MASKKTSVLPAVKQMANVNKTYLKDALKEIQQEYAEHTLLLQKKIKGNKDSLVKIKSRLKGFESKHKAMAAQLENKKTKALQERVKKSTAKIKLETSLLRNGEKEAESLKKELAELNSVKKMQKALQSSINGFYKTYTAEPAAKPAAKVKKPAVKQAKKKAKVKSTEPVKQDEQAQPNLFAMEAESSGLNVGQAAPAFSALSDNGDEINLSQFAGQQVVLYFYPKDDTPGCTQESKDFTGLQQQFAEANTIILGVSRDSVASHAKFKDKYGFNFSLLADTDETICAAYGVMKEKNRYGKMVLGIERSTFLIDAEGNLKHMWRNVRVAEHAQAVLTAATADRLVSA
jgi:thioredoxin-dependent peroxiredoxin